MADELTRQSLSHTVVVQSTPSRPSWFGRYAPVVAWGTVLTAEQYLLAERRVTPSAAVSYLPESPAVAPPDATTGDLVIGTSVGISRAILTAWGLAAATRTLRDWLQRTQEVRNLRQEQRLLREHQDECQAERDAQIELRAELRQPFDAADRRERTERRRDGRARRLAQAAFDRTPDHLAAAFAQDIAAIQSGQAARQSCLALLHSGRIVAGRTIHFLGEIMLAAPSFLATTAVRASRWAYAALHLLPGELSRLAVSTFDSLSRVVATGWRHLRTAASALLDIGEALLWTQRGRRRLVVVAVTAGTAAAMAGAVTLLGGCGLRPPQPARQIHAIILLDTSSSFCGVDRPCEPGAAANIFRALAEITRLPPELVVEVRLLGSGPEAPPLYRAETPVRWFGGRQGADDKLAFVQKTTAEMDALNVPTGGGSDYAQSVWYAGELLRQSGANEPYLVVVGDLRDERMDENGRDIWNFSSGVPDPNSYIEERRQDGTLPRLDGVTVVACGLHLRSTDGVNHAWSVADHRAVTDLWRQTWTAAGASSSDFLTTCDAGPVATALSALKEVNHDL